MTDIGATEENAAIEGPRINFPEWTEFSEKNGLDPLGMQNSSVDLYQTFLPGISNVTLRMRYYGLYAWLCRSYALEVGDKDPNTWKRYVRRTEALYALVAHAHGSEGGVAGIEWAGKQLQRNDIDVIDFASAADPGSEQHYLQQAWGAFGAAYGSQLHAITLLTTTSEHGIPLVTDIGEELAIAFAAALGPLAPEFLRVVQRGTATRDEISSFAIMAPSEISLISDERALYQRLLVRDDLPDDARSFSRRLTIQLILSVTRLLGREPKPDEIRWIYAGTDADGQPLDFEAPSLQAQRERWWVYHANDLAHVAWAGLLKFVLDTLGHHPAGITLQHLLATCVDQVLEVADMKNDSWAAFVDAIEPAPSPYSAQSQNSEWRLSQDIIRGAGRSDAKVCSPEVAWMAFKLMALLQKRMNTEGHDIAAELGQFETGDDAFRSLLSETRYLANIGDRPFREALSLIFEERIFRRHLWVALRKFRYQRDYTFLIEMDEGRLRLRDKDGPTFTNPRLATTIAFLKDIHLISRQGVTNAAAQVEQLQ